MIGLKMKYFVLNPRSKSVSDPYAKASRMALEAYARSISVVNSGLSLDLCNWANEERYKEGEVKRMDIIIKKPEKTMFEKTKELFKKIELLEKINWYFETEDALRDVRLMLQRGQVTLSAYKELAMWAGAAESDLRKLCSERARDVVQIPLPF